MSVPSTVPQGTGPAGAVPSGAILGRVRAHWAGRRRIERLCHLIGAALMVSGIFHFGVFLVQGGPWEGPVSWRKPTTFGLSFGLTLISITWVASHLLLSPRARAWLLGVFAADCVLEVAGITVQAWRHVPSHFNTETPLNTVIAMSLAFGGAVLIVVLGALAITAFRGRTRGPADLRLALRAGFGLLLAGMATGAAMIAKGEVLIRSGHRQEAYDTAGSLKWVHGLTLHAVVVLPALAVLLTALGRPPERRYRTVAAAIGLYAAAGVATLVISLIR
ncbi:hypothetical protein NE235_18150 [Actinoallomurus spadix]|uniref:Uncharacterized protein n=1 Tax=Actinoallomurus spadix TaxID=79912 RepID=A0ABP3FL54_9ACTN|nr:hypothetical protein [Actinoallomurus spadix]MCO5988027.1 hypothetical protein [Actinoallomurus spadix]